MTPTERMPGRTVKYCQIFSSRPAFLISSRKMASLSRTISSFSGVISPIIRIPRPGPGNGCRQTNSCGIPNFSPNSRVSSLKSFRNGSINLKPSFFGSPPTLWWDLMVCAVSVPDSITSVYRVPCAKKSAFGIFLASSLKTSTNSLPMIFRFFSGSVTPFSLLRKRSAASTLTILTPRSRFKAFITWSASFFRSKPWSTKIQVNWSPIAR